MPENKKRIIIIDDEPLIPALIKELIDHETGLEIAQITSNKEDFLSAVVRDHFDMALIDISVGGREGGIDVLKLLMNKGINLPGIMLSAHDELLYALPCLKAGASGYIGKDSICTELVKGLKEVGEGRLFVSGSSGKSIIEQYKSFVAVK